MTTVLLTPEAELDLEEIADYIAADNPARDLEPFLRKNAGDVALRLDLLETELAEAEELVDHLLREDTAILDLRDDLFRAGGRTVFRQRPAHEVGA